MGNLTETTNITETINFLKTYNLWRRGAEIAQPNPTEIGIAISDIVELVEDSILISGTENKSYLKTLLENHIIELTVNRSKLKRMPVFGKNTKKIDNINYQIGLVKDMLLSITRTPEKNNPCDGDCNKCKCNS